MPITLLMAPLDFQTFLRPWSRSHRPTNNKSIHFCPYLQAWPSKPILQNSWLNLTYALIWASALGTLLRGHRELMDGRLCRPDSEQWPWTSNLCIVNNSKIILAQLHTKCIFHAFFCYRPTDLSLLKEFSKYVSFSNSYNLPS